MSISNRKLTSALLALPLVAVLAACSSGGPAPDPTVTATQTVTASPSTGTGTSASPSTAPTATPGPDGASGGGGDLGEGSTGTASDRCTVSELSVDIADGGGGAAGSVGIAFIFTNTGSRSCTLQGWPGVSFVGDGDGTQIGASATLDRSSAHPALTLAPQDEVQAILTIAQAANYDDADCRPVTADGFRIYPPGSVESIFVAAGGSLVDACSSTSASQLSVGALQTF